MKILVSGFKPFNGEYVNPSWEVAAAFQGRRIGSHGAVAASICLETAFFQGMKELIDAVRQHEPDAVLCLGQAQGRSRISLERIAVNVMDASIPDNAGWQPRDLPVAEDGPAAYFSNLPLREFEQRLREEEIPVEISNTAGSYVCNAVFYALRHNFPGLPGGFVHIPLSSRQVLDKPGAIPHMSIETMETALELMLSVLADRVRRNGP